MKKILFLFLLALLASCSDDIQDNSPAIQGVRDTILYRSAVNRAQRVNQGVLVIGSNNDEKLSLSISNYNEGTFTLGADESSSAQYNNAKGKVFSTIYDGEGEIIVSRIADSTITGTFRFRAGSFSDDSTNVVFTKGVFYKVPISPSTDPLEVDDPVSTNFNCRINSAYFNPQAVSATESNGEIVGYGSTPSTIIRINFPVDIEKGVYALSAANSSGAYRVVYNSGGNPQAISSGTLEITSHNFSKKSVGGTFSFNVGTDGATEITEGVFGFNYGN
ncbi:MAG: DUF6252 family protein [Leeuwenhoekiella sp.]